MAKTTNPLFSLSAAGSVGNIVFRNPLAGQTAAASKFKPADKPTPAQLNARAKLKAAAAMWATLDATERAAWAALGVNIRYANQAEISTNCPHGYARFVQEFIIQQTEAGALPLMPK